MTTYRFIVKDPLESIMKCDARHAPDNFYSFNDNCDAHITLRNTLHIVQLIVCAYAVVSLSRSLLLHRRKNVQQFWMSWFLVCTIIGQILVGITATIVLVNQQGRPVAMLTLICAVAFHYYGAICFAIILLLPFKMLVTMKVIRNITLFLQAVASFVLPLGFLMYAYFLLRNWDDIRKRNVLIGVSNMYIVVMIFSMILLLMYTLKKLNDGFARQEGPSIVLNSKMRAVSKKLKTLCFRVLILLGILDSIVFLSAIQIIVFDRHPMGWIAYPLNFWISTIGSIIVSKVVKPERRGSRNQSAYSTSVRPTVVLPRKDTKSLFLIN